MHVTEGLLRELSLLSENERIILSVYLDLNQTKDQIDAFIEKEAERLASEIYDDNNGFLKNSVDAFVDHVERIWDDRPEGIAFFADLGVDYVQPVDLMSPPEESKMILDNEAHIRQLALEMDDYEPVGIIMADASGARILIAAGKTIDKLDSMKTDILHLTKVGGWSQMRYQRRRQQEVVHFVKDVAEDADKIFRDEHVNGILLAGRDRLISELKRHLPKWLDEKVMGKVAWDLEESNEEFLKKIQPEMERMEREQEEKCLTMLEAETKRNGLAATGLSDTMRALQIGQVDTLFIKKDLDDNLSEELTSLAESISAHVEFVPGENEFLDKHKGVAALLRYKIK